MSAGFTALQLVQKVLELPTGGKEMELKEIRNLYNRVAIYAKCKILHEPAPHKVYSSSAADPRYPSTQTRAFGWHFLA